LETFADSRVAAAVDSGWPAALPAGMNAFNGNMLCLFSQWKVGLVEADLIEIFSKYGGA